jgi:hypothetical protein
MPDLTLPLRRGAPFFQTTPLLRDHFMSAIYINTGEQRSLISRSITALRAKDAPNSFVVLDTASNEVVTYSKPNNSPWVRQKAIDVPWRDPAEFDPLPVTGSGSNSDLQAGHDAQVRDMLGHMATYYRPDLAERPLFADFVGEMAASVQEYAQPLSKLPDARARWDALLSIFVSAVDASAGKSKRKAKRGKVKG